MSADGRPTCETCWFWRAGFCCRFPPAPETQPPFRFAIFPETKPDDWCGEHRPAGASPPIETRGET